MCIRDSVWDEWADEDGSIGKAYGYQLGVKHQYKEGMMDQVDRVIYDLKHNPFSRRIMTNIYVHQDLHEMNLYPCAYSMTFNVTHKEGDEKLTLNAIPVSYTHLGTSTTTFLEMEAVSTSICTIFAFGANSFRSPVIRSLNLVPMENKTSHSLTALLLAYFPCIPVFPI